MAQSVFVVMGDRSDSEVGRDADSFGDVVTDLLEPLDQDELDATALPSA
jgi:hypothetical protein